MNRCRIYTTRDEVFAVRLDIEQTEELIENAYGEGCFLVRLPAVAGDMLIPLSNIARVTIQDTDAG